MAAFKVNQLEEVQNWVQSEERLFLTADRERVVAEDDPEAAFLFASPSDRISVEDAARYGLIKSKAKAEAPAEAPAEAEEPAKPAPKKRAKKKS
jgi:hypothetical protein